MKSYFDISRCYLIEAFYALQENASGRLFDSVKALQGFKITVDVIVWSGQWQSSEYIVLN